MSVYYATVSSGDDIPAEYEWTTDRASAEEQALELSREENDVYMVVEIETREVARTRITVVLDTV